MRVSIIEESSYIGLQYEINQYLRRFQSQKIFDIKYSSMIDKCGNCYYSAMIIYE